jgi:hypothetical protein
LYCLYRLLPAYCSDLFNKHQRSMVVTSDICLAVMYSLLVSLQPDT